MKKLLVFAAEGGGSGDATDGPLLCPAGVYRGFF